MPEEVEGDKFWRKQEGGRCRKDKRKKKRGNDVILIQCLKKILLKKKQNKSRVAQNPRKVEDEGRVEELVIFRAWKLFCIVHMMDTPHSASIKPTEPYNQ